MKTIYNSEAGKRKILALYDEQLKRLDRPYQDVYVNTSFGKTHLIENAKIKTAMPSDVSAELMRQCKAPTLVMAAEKDCLFPGPGVIERAKQIIPDCETYLLAGRGHMNFLSDEEKKMIVDFLKD